NFNGRSRALVSEDLVRRARGSWTRFLWIPVLLIVAGGAVAGAYYGYRWLANRAPVEKEEEKPIPEYPDGVIRFDPLGGDWEGDEHARKGLSAAIARKRGKPRNHLAIHFQDYKTELPSRAVMVDLAL